MTLTEQGHVCFGEKHQEIIRNQRTTIAQLRERVSELEQAKPPSKLLTMQLCNSILNTVK